jgi:hypothetical protein
VGKMSKRNKNKMCKPQLSFWWTFFWLIIFWPAALAYIVYHFVELRQYEINLMDQRYNKGKGVVEK